MAAVPVHGTVVSAAAADELAEVRWVSSRAAEELLPGMFGPFREHLDRLAAGTYCRAPGQPLLVSSHLPENRPFEISQSAISYDPLALAREITFPSTRILHMTLPPPLSWALIA